MAKFKVRIGPFFEVEAVEIEEIEDAERWAAICEKRALADRQARIAYLMLGAVAAASIGGAIVGWVDGSFDELGTVLAASSGWVVMVLRPYFRKD